MQTRFSPLLQDTVLLLFTGGHRHMTGRAVQHSYSLQRRSDDQTLY